MCGTHNVPVICLPITQITFEWAWSKGPLGGSGQGELFLEGGALDVIFLVGCLEGSQAGACGRGH